MKFWSLIILLTIFALIGINVFADTKESINSLELIEYLNKNNKINDVKKVCTVDYCSKELFGNKEKEIKMFINSYVNLIKKKSLDEGISVELKGFKITKIIYYDT